MLLDQKPELNALNTRRNPHLLAKGLGEAPLESGLLLPAPVELRLVRSPSSMLPTPLESGLVRSPSSMLPLMLPCSPSSTLPSMLPSMLPRVLVVVPTTVVEPELVEPELVEPELVVEVVVVVVEVAPTAPEALQHEAPKLTSWKFLSQVRLPIAPSILPDAKWSPRSMLPLAVLPMRLLGPSTPRPLQIASGQLSGRPSRRQGRLPVAPAP